LKKIIIIAGPNGAGKTTFAREFLPAEAQTLRFLNADLIAAGLAPFNPESASFKAGRLMLEAIDEYVEAGHSFAFETTLSGMFYLKKISLWQVQGYQVKLWFLSLPNEEIAVSRVARRVRQGGHNIPEDVIRRRFKAGIENLYVSYIKAVDSWAIYDGSSMQPMLIYWCKKLNDKDIRKSSDSDLSGSYAAMERAAFAAQDLAIKTNTGIVVDVEGKNVELTAADLIKLRDAEERSSNI
jgi:predicted ABC-type ATPase